MHKVTPVSPQLQIVSKAVGVALGGGGEGRGERSKRVILRKLLLVSGQREVKLPDNLILFG